MTRPVLGILGFPLRPEVSCRMTCLPVLMLCPPLMYLTRDQLLLSELSVGAFAVNFPLDLLQTCRSSLQRKMLRNWRLGC